MEGFYTIVFQGPVGAGGGAVFLQNGQVLGGDSAYFYQGSYTQSGNQIHAFVDVRVFLSGVQSVFGVAAPFALEMVGTVVGNEITGTACLAGNANARMHLRMTKRASLAVAAPAGGAR